MENRLAQLRGVPDLIGIADAQAVPVPPGPRVPSRLRRHARRDHPRISAVLVCAPNKPTGTTLPPKQLRALITAIPGDVLIPLDRAYQEFDHMETDVAALVAEHPNVIVFRTLSKAYGLAGLRAGYAVGSPEVIRVVRETAPPFGLSAAAEAAALTAWADLEHTRLIVNAVTACREDLRRVLSARGLPTPDARATCRTCSACGAARCSAPAVRQPLGEPGGAGRRRDGRHQMSAWENTALPLWSNSQPQWSECGWVPTGAACSLEWHRQCRSIARKGPIPQGYRAFGTGIGHSGTGARG
ncbi:aminotransferase class I/II-fold pyridoxal phosphate-dependent enzyme [Streptomyces sp. NPDC002205]|uniref:aminotransferase class I/II-fold pyridoxal phosphate-dependent enzyme n=1 Tax=Streptomyces sp. NPDC002205 TaxID=3154411 RepID=UPI003330C1F6